MILILFNVVQVLVIGAPLYCSGMPLRMVVWLHAALAVAWLVYHLVVGAWDNIDTGVLLFILAACLALGALVVHKRQQKEQPSTSRSDTPSRPAVGANDVLMVCDPATGKMGR